MRFALLALPILAACAPEDEPQASVLWNNLDPSSVTVAGTRSFTDEAIAAGIEPSPSILARAEKLCPNPRFLSATPTHDDPRRVNYFFLCP